MGNIINIILSEVTKQYERNKQELVYLTLLCKFAGYMETEQLRFEIVERIRVNTNTINDYLEALYVVSHYTVNDDCINN